MKTSKDGEVPKKVKSARPVKGLGRKQRRAEYREKRHDENARRKKAAHEKHLAKAKARRERKRLALRQS